MLSKSDTAKLPYLDIPVPVFYVQYQVLTILVSRQQDERANLRSRPIRFDRDYHNFFDQSAFESAHTHKYRNKTKFEYRVH